jgi:hypothetical protein
MNKINAVIAATALIVAVLGCSSMMKGKELSEAAVAKFHEQFNAGRYEDVYNDADDEFKKNVTLEQWTELASAVKRKLGSVKNSTSTGWHVNTTPSGTIATVSYDVDFDEGKGTEQFTFLVSDEKAKLYNYNVNSPLLITR